MPSVPALCRLVGVHESVGRRWSASKRIVSIGPAASTRGFEALALRTLASISNHCHARRTGTVIFCEGVGTSDGKGAEMAGAALQN